MKKLIFLLSVLVSFSCSNNAENTQAVDSDQLVAEIISISNDFYHMDVRLKHSFWNRNPNKSIWGGSISSAMDPFFPILIKQILLRKGIETDFYSQAIQVQFIKMVKSDVIFHFRINENEITLAEKALNEKGKYSDWHSVEGISARDEVCVKGKVQVFLRKRG